MPIPAPDFVESALLYHRNYTPISSQELLDELNKQLKPAKLAFKNMRAKDGGGFSLFGNGRYFILVSQSQEPMPANSLVVALASAFGRISFPTMTEAVANHRSNIFISISNNMPTLASAPADKKDIKKLMHEQTQQDFELKLGICHLMTNILASKNRPEAIHWRQSNQIMSPVYFAQMLRMAFPIPLFVHPGLFSSQTEVNGRSVIGIRTQGAAHLIGREIILNEAPVPLSWLFQRMCEFIELVRKRKGHEISDGETVSLAKGEVFRVRGIKPTKDEPLGMIDVTLESSNDFKLAAAAAKPATKKKAVKAPAKKKKLH